MAKQRDTSLQQIDPSTSVLQSLHNLITITDSHYLLVLKWGPINLVILWTHRTKRKHTTFHFLCIFYHSSVPHFSSTRIILLPLSTNQIQTHSNHHLLCLTRFFAFKITNISHQIINKTFKYKFSQKSYMY